MDRSFSLLNVLVFRCWLSFILQSIFYTRTYRIVVFCTRRYQQYYGYSNLLNACLIVFFIQFALYAVVKPLAEDSLDIKCIIALVYQDYLRLFHIGPFDQRAVTPCSPLGRNITCFTQFNNFLCWSLAAGITYWVKEDWGVRVVLILFGVGHLYVGTHLAFSHTVCIQLGSSTVLFRAQTQSRLIA